MGLMPKADPGKWGRESILKADPGKWERGFRIPKTDSGHCSKYQRLIQGNGKGALDSGKGA
jgi:hypothetical protein